VPHYYVNAHSFAEMVDAMVYSSAVLVLVVSREGYPDEIMITTSPSPAVMLHPNYCLIKRAVINMEITILGRPKQTTCQIEDYSLYLLPLVQVR